MEDPSAHPLSPAKLPPFSPRTSTPSEDWKYGQGMKSLYLYPPQFPSLPTRTAAPHLNNHTQKQTEFYFDSSPYGNTKYTHGHKSQECPPAHILTCYPTHKSYGPTHTYEGISLPHYNKRCYICENNSKQTPQNTSYLSLTHSAITTHNQHPSLPDGKLYYTSSYKNSLPAPHHYNLH